MFDITNLAATETSIVELVGGDDAPLFDDKGKRLTITVYGPGTKVYQRAQQRRAGAAHRRFGLAEEVAPDAAAPQRADEGDAVVLRG